MLKIALISPLPPSFGGMTTLGITLKKSLEEQQIKIIPINTNPFVGLINKGNEKRKKIQQGIIYLFKLRKVIGCDGAIIISSSGDYFYTKALTALFVCKLFKCKVILDFVGGAVLEFSMHEKSRLIKKLRKFNHIIAPSVPFKEFFDQAGLNCTLFPHIVDIEKFHPERKHVDKPILLSAKNLEEYSNISSIIKAFALIKNQFPDASLLITGGGPQKEFLQALTKELTLTNVEFLENISDEQMPNIYAKATILLHATRLESFGITIVEALASGTPVISSRVGGIPDIIKDGVNGFLIDYNDHEAMASQAVFLLKNKSVFDNFVTEGLSTAQLYSSDNLGPKLKLLLETIVKPN